MKKHIALFKINPKMAGLILNWGVAFGLFQLGSWLVKELGRVPSLPLLIATGVVAALSFFQCYRLIRIFISGGKNGKRKS